MGGLRGERREQDMEEQKEITKDKEMGWEFKILEGSGDKGIIENHERDLLDSWKCQILMDMWLLRIYKDTQIGK